VEHRLTVPLSVHAPRQVRQSFDRLVDTVDNGLLDDLRILSTEVVSNAVVHSGRPTGDPIAVVTRFRPGSVRVEVIDGGQGVTPLRPRSTSPPSGLHLVELVSDRWSSGVGSFHVWFEIDTRTNALIRRRTHPDARRATATGGVAGRPERPERLEVVPVPVGKEP
jgi:anti-sigma regulatory factor (Ser/Thr protein kinase)